MPIIHKIVNVMVDKNKKRNIYCFTLLPLPDALQYLIGFFSA